jgi:hypothetical protein
MLASLLSRRPQATVAVLKQVVAPSVVAFPVDLANWSLYRSDGSAQQQQQQVRWVTKKRQHRQEKHKRKAELAEQGIFSPKPHGYIPVDTPVINAVSKAERLAESKRQDEIAAEELKAKMNIVKAPLMRFGFDPSQLTMSDRVKQLFELNNGNQKEVVKAQKYRGMELFQRREGDTGSSGVQGKLQFDI